MKNERGFTLIEMMIVLLIISALLLIMVPNISTHSSNIDKKGCEAYIKMVGAQVQAYKIDKGDFPTFEELHQLGYLKDANATCPDGTPLKIGADGEVARVTTP